MIFRYDGSYAGLLTVLQRLFARRETPDDIVRHESEQADLFAEVFPSNTEPELAARLNATIREHLGTETAANLRDAFLSDQPGIEMALYRYLRLGWRVRRELDRHLTDPEVATVHRAAQRTRHEAHRFKGLLRFRETDDGLLYAPFRPAADILAHLAAHFAIRLGDRRWLIHDVRRDLGALYDGRHWAIGALRLETAPTFSAEEDEWQELWRTFFHHIAIPERANPRLQKRFMPMKYWEFLVEKN
ncbi:TIGR03915 family putative DNA repair protein [Trichloromonas sp.]|uniref:TIGR03915 family putative DNA repair protein n=1 Tax=Trichloromonas sp. TaxID=3069249 RepID=UPI002A3D0777|nr:TIGR03915 family putative DNA repair protein [Trichloromonas sp.]